MDDADNLICQGRNLRIRYTNKKDGEVKGKIRKILIKIKKIQITIGEMKKKKQADGIMLLEEKLEEIPGAFAGVCPDHRRPASVRLRLRRRG